MRSILGFIGRHGRWSLIAGLLGGLTLPDVALAIRPWLPHLIAVLLCVSAFRIGPRATLGSCLDLSRGVGRVLTYQLAAPLLALAVLHIQGWADTLPGIALVLILAAPSISGAPNFTAMMGHDPTRAMRLLLLGTALFPLTVFPVLLALPSIPTVGEVLMSAGRLLAVIGVAVSVGFALRRDRQLGQEGRDACDGLAALLLAVIVVGLMSAMRPALANDRGSLLVWLTFVFAVNFGLQTVVFSFDHDRDVGGSVVAGNRNIALFLVALPTELTDELLLFIGCYQIPMYLTPILMRPLYQRAA